jgi:hypothetical protein
MTPPDRLIPTSEQESQSFQTLQADNQRLREVIVSLSAALLRSIALDPTRDLSTPSSIDSRRLLLEAEVCLRCAKIPGLKRETIESLEAAGHGFMARAVEIETMLQRAKWKK